MDLSEKQLRWINWGVMLSILAGCYLGANVNLVTSNPAATPVVQNAVDLTPTPAAPAQNEAGWLELAPGLEFRIDQPPGQAFTQFHVLRIDPALFEFRAHYSPGQPKTLTEWQAAAPQAVAIVNANFFSGSFLAQGLLVIDGIVQSPSYRGYGGTFDIVGDMLRIRSNLIDPYQGEFLDQAVQGFPMLVLDGQAAYISSRPDRNTRRAVIGQDRAGRIILMATPLLGMTLTNLSAYLPTTDLELVSAFNLDGGGSTMMAVAGLDNPIFSFDPVPVILAVYPAS